MTTDTESKAQATELVQYHHSEPASAALSVAEVKTRLMLIKEVMANAMQENQDYGKIPGCGDKPGLFQPGAQKLSMMFQLNPEVRQETINEFPQFHRGYRLIVRVTNGSKFADGVGECSTLESKYRYRNAGLKCPSCGKETILKSKNQGEGWFCWQKKGGCGATFPMGDAQMTDHKQGKVDHENPPDFWNTARKMAFKRAFVHAIINATNTSELWSQDLEDLAANGVMGEAPKQAPEPPPARQETQKPVQTPSSQPARPEATQIGDTIREDVGFVSFKKVESKTGAAKPWTAHFCTFERQDGEKFEAGTFSKTVAESFDVLKGYIVTLVHQPGKKEGTREIVSVGPPEPKTPEPKEDDVPF